MPRNGSGGFSLDPSTWNPGVDGVTATTADWNTKVKDDLEDAIAGSLATDGQSTMVGNLKMGNNRVTGMADAVAVTDGATANDVQSGEWTYLTSVSGTNTITASLTGLTAYLAGQSFRFIAASSSTAAVTLNINSIGAKNVINGVFVAGATYQIAYDGTQFVVVGSELPQGQCRLAKSGATLLLSPLNGNRLYINGVNYAIPSAGVTLAAPATTNTTYYIYAYMSSGTMTLEASATVPATDATTGVRIKTGDASRTLVGMARTVGSAWVDTAAQRFVISWFNQRGLSGSAAYTANRTVGTTAFTELNTEIRNEFLTWAGNQVSAEVDGSCFSDTAGIVMTTSIAIDSTSTPQEARCVYQAAAINYRGAITCAVPTNSLSEGYHYATVIVSTSGGLNTWDGSATPGSRCSLKTWIQG